MTIIMILKTSYTTTTYKCLRGHFLGIAEGGENDDDDNDEGEDANEGRVFGLLLYIFTQFFIQLVSHFYILCANEVSSVLSGN